MENLITKQDLLKKLRSYTESPDDENVLYKKKIKKALLESPELLYALHNEELESELFNKNGEINWNPITHEPYGEWDRYFGETSNIRSELFIPETQSKIKHFVCYQINFDEFPRYNSKQKYTEITFTILCQEKDITDKETGISRHDLIGSIIQDRFNWSNIFGMQTHLISSKESLTDNHYVVRTLVFQLTDLNNIYKTSNGVTSVTNYRVRK